MTNLEFKLRRRELLQKFFFPTCCFNWTKAFSHIIGYIPGPNGSLFAIAPTHILEWQFCHPFMHLGIAFTKVINVCFTKILNNEIEYKF